MMNLYEIGQKGLQMAKEMGATEAEVAISTGKKMNVSAKNNALHVATSDQSSWLGIRVIKDASLGFAATNSFDTDKVTKSVKEAIGIAKSAPKDEHNVLPDPTPLPTVEGIYDPKLEQAGLEQAIGYVTQILDTVKAYDKRATVESADLSVSIGRSLVFNTKGVSCDAKSTNCSFLVFGMAVDGDDVSSFSYEYGAATNLDGFDVVKKSRRFASEVVSSLGAKPGKTFKGPIILYGDALMELLIGTIIYSASADNVQQGTSRFAGMQGKHVASKLLTITDNGTIKGRIMSSPFDREGVAPKTFDLIHEGKLTDYFHNCRTASRQGEQSNGHASGNASTPPFVGPTNMVVKSGKGTLDDLVADTNQGVLVKRFSGNFDPTTGDFSGTVKGGYLIEHGKVTTPLLGTMIAGNVFDIMQNITGITEEVEDLGSCILPSIRFEGVNVTSGQ